MHLTVYVNSSDPRKLNKAITQKQSFTAIKLKDDTDIIRPTIDLFGEQLPPGVNYAFITEFNRYYFIESQEILPGKITRLQLSCDVLMSFKTQILKSYVIAVRSTNKPNKSLVDIIPISSKRNLIYKLLKGSNENFGSDKLQPTSRCYLLTVATGG